MALRQLWRIADADNSALRITNVEDKSHADQPVLVDVSLDCTHYKHAPDGLTYHARESVRLSIPADFPYAIPTVSTAHTRFLGHPHVQWGVRLCMYLSPETQWLPSRGMIGFVEKLDDWFRKAALNELDDPAGPMHPPVAYTVSNTAVLVQVNAPEISDWPWFGAGIVKRRKSNLVEVTGWEEVYHLDKATVFAPAILLDFELPFEFPRTMRQLLQRLEKGGVSRSKVLVHLMLAAERLDRQEPMYVVLGTPSRGITGDPEQRLQHLQAWEINATDVIKLRAASVACDVSARYQELRTPEDIQQLIDSIFDDLFKWERESQVGWCSVLENRPEIVTRRDVGTEMDWFKGRKVAVWGCGALGSLVAEHLLRADVGSITLYDNKAVNPGVLVRQNFVDADINELKVAVLRERLLAIAPAATVVANPVNLISDTLNNDDWSDEFDVIIDATASLRVRSKLEAVLIGQDRRPPIVAMMISGTARHGALAVIPPDYTGGSLDVFRRLGLAAMNRPWLEQSAQAFWSANNSAQLRQPEPGCSDPTFVASHVDIAAIAARMLNKAAAELSDQSDEAIGALIAQDAGQHPDRSFRFRPHVVIRGDGLEFRIAEGAWRDVRGWIHAGARERTSEDETGGLAFGQVDEALGIIWVSNVCGPPRDSTFSPEGFVCGVDGTKALSQEYASRTSGIVQYIGTWHSHPVSAARPSETDFGGIASIFTENPSEGPQQIMMIVGHASTSEPEIGAYAFERRELEISDNFAALAMTFRGGRAPAPELCAIDTSIGLALSGGGSRAVAFHLGTLRALEDLGLLHEIETISGVSGGSLVTGMIGYTQDDFEELDKRIVSVLKRGLVFPALLKLLHPGRAVQLLLAGMFVSLPALIIDSVRVVLSQLIAFVPGLSKFNGSIARLRWPFRRWYSRTHVLSAAMESAVGSQVCSAATRDGKNIVFNACELRTGTAFRMSNEQFGSWRFGWAPSDQLRVADAVTASAAFPPALPPFDWSFQLEKSGEFKQERLLITDGGVFENIGVSVMEPGRDSSFSAIGYSPKIIIASDAGAGQFSGRSFPSSWPPRMVQVVNAVMRKVQDATKARLHQHAADGRIDRFVYANLGQIDSKLPLKPSRWIDREDVVNYPTDFSAMTKRNVEKISGRGEAIMRTLATQYLLSD